MASYENVLDLPNEILMHIASFLQSKELITCTSVCDKLYAICSEYCLWRRFFVDLNCPSTCAEQRPAGRLCHTGAVNNNKMYIFGGHMTQPSSEYFHSVKQDLFEYDFDSRQWSEYTFDTAPRRTEHTSVFYNDQMLVFGGYSGSGYENSVMAFDTKTKTWSQMATNGEAPTARSAHTSVVVGHTMLIFGGWNGVHCMNDLHALDLQTSTWKLITPPTAASPRTNAQTMICTGDAPVARCSHGAVGVSASQGCSSSNVMYVFGGYSIEGSNDSVNKGYLCDLHEFNIDTLTWRQLKTSGIPPSPRSRFRMIAHKESLYLFAGWNSAKHFSSLHRYNSISNQWSEISTDFDSDGIGQFSLVENKGIMYVFSGFSPTVGCRSNLFAYPLAPSEISQSP